MDETAQDAMSPEEMLQMQDAVGKGGQDVTELVKTIAASLQKLAGIIEKSDSATDKDKQQIGEILASFIDLVESKLAEGAGEDKEEVASPELSQVPVDQGRTGIPMGPQGRQ